VTPVPVTPATEAAPPAQSSLPILPPPELAGPETTPVEAAPAPVATPTNNEGVYWALGGGVALLLGIGAFAFLHRRDRKEEASKHALLAEPAFSQRVQPTAAVGPTPSTPVPHVPEPQDYAAAPRWSPSATKASADSRFPELEAMVAERPSSENPFVTRRARLRRAEFIHRMGHAPQGPAIATHTPEAAIQAPRKRPQQVYNFGTGAVSFRPQGWKPATT
jgi:hypothetical protein